MEHGTNQILFALLRSVFSGTKVHSETPELSAEAFCDLLVLASKHDMEHLVIYALQQNGLIPEEYSAVQNKLFEAVFRGEQLCFEYERICNALESAEIPFIPLKGAVVRKYYPEPWMRTSCDIDILVDKDDLEKSVATLVDKCEYTYHKKGSHDVALISPSRIRVELHYNLIEKDVSAAAADILSRVWETASVCEGFRWQHKMSDEMFYFYHIAHMAKHFENGGCGIRPFADIWLMENNGVSNGEKVSELLAQGNLLVFARAAQKLSKVWFDNAETDSVSLKMEEYVLNGGTFGSTKNRIAVQQQKKGGKTGYLFTKIFLPYDEIKFIYPILQKHRWLTPLMEVLRWLRLIFGSRSKNIAKEIKLNQSVTAEESDATREFLASVGLLENNNRKR